MQTSSSGIAKSGVTTCADSRDEAFASADADDVTQNSVNGAYSTSSRSGPTALHELDDSFSRSQSAAAFEAELMQGDRFVAPSGNVYEGMFLGMTVWDSPRRNFIMLVEWAWFDRIVLILIIFNCALLAAQGPEPNMPPIMSSLMLYLQICFTIEMAVKMMASGIVANKNAYIWSTWNCLDLLVVVTGWMPYVSPMTSNVSAIRSIRALRPLRSIKRMPGVKALVDTMIEAAPGLANVVMLCAFIFLVFGILGMQLFKGVLRYHCFEPGATQPVDDAAICRPSDPSLCAPGQVCRCETGNFL